MHLTMKEQIEYFKIKVKSKKIYFAFLIDKRTKNINMRSIILILSLIKLIQYGSADKTVYFEEKFDGKHFFKRKKRKYQTN